MSFVYSNYKMKDNTIFFNDFAVYRKGHFGVMVPADIKSFKIINDRYAKDRFPQKCTKKPVMFKKILLLFIKLYSR